MKKNYYLLKKDPFSLTQKEKENLFLLEIKKTGKWHYENSVEFKRLCDKRGFNFSQKFDLLDLPYFPVSIFKNFDLISVSSKDIIKTLYSSSTSGMPSKIMIDKITAENQTIALNKIMSNFFGKERWHLIVFDNEKTIKDDNKELSSRGTAIRGMFSMTKKITFILDENLNLKKEILESIFYRNTSEEKICFFGFTWIIYNVYLKYRDNKEILNLFKDLFAKKKILLHIGGWKKLKDISVSKEDFNEKLSKNFFLNKRDIVDFYGMTEQLGTVYPDCEYGYKHIPIYSDIIIRDINTLKVVENGEVGFIQFLSPLPHSYPGISILSDDMGKIVGTDNCKCKRKGKYFLFEKRSEKVELKGCGDTAKI